MLTFFRRHRKIESVKDTSQQLHTPLETRVLEVLMTQEGWDPEDFVKTVAVSTHEDTNRVRETIWHLLDRRQIAVTADRRFRPAGVPAAAAI